MSSINLQSVVTYKTFKNLKKHNKVFKIKTKMF